MFTELNSAQDHSRLSSVKDRASSVLEEGECESEAIYTQSSSKIDTSGFLKILISIENTISKI